MAEVVIKLDVPPEFKEELKVALAKAMKELVRNIELSLAKELISQSKFTEEDADELSEKVKLSMHKDLKKKGLV